MAGDARQAVWLLLLSAVASAAFGQLGLTYDLRVYNVLFPCEDDYVCFHMWRVTTDKVDDDVAVLTNGNLQLAELEGGTSKCVLPIKDHTDEEYYHFCHRSPGVSPPYSGPSSAPELTLPPGRSTSLQCRLLSSVTSGQCGHWRRRVRLTWLDEAGAPIEEDSDRRIRQDSLCDATLTITFHSSGQWTFICQVTSGREVQASVKLRVRVPATKGKGRGLIIPQEEEPQEEGDVVGSGQDVVAPAVGVLLVAVVLTALVAAFAVNRRRMRLQFHTESRSAGNSAVSNADEVIYSEVFFPAASDQVRPHELTEYACVRPK